MNIKENGASHSPNRKRDADDDVKIEDPSDSEKCDVDILQLYLLTKGEADVESGMERFRGTLNERQRGELKLLLKDLKLKSKQGKHREYAFVDITPENSLTQLCQIDIYKDDEKVGSEEMTVDRYYKDMFDKPLRYPLLPLVQCAPAEKRIFLPIEVLDITANLKEVIQNLPSERKDEVIEALLEITDTGTAAKRPRSKSPVSTPQGSTRLSLISSKGSPTAKPPASKADVTRETGTHNENVPPVAQAVNSSPAAKPTSAAAAKPAATAAPKPSPAPAQTQANTAKAQNNASTAKPKAMTAAAKPTAMQRQPANLPVKRPIPVRVAPWANQQAPMGVLVRPRPPAPSVNIPPPPVSQSSPVRPIMQPFLRPPGMSAMPNGSSPFIGGPPRPQNGGALSDTRMRTMPSSMAPPHFAGPQQPSSQGPFTQNTPSDVRFAFRPGPAGPELAMFRASGPTGPTQMSQSQSAQMGASFGGPPLARMQFGQPPTSMQQPNFPFGQGPTIGPPMQQAPGSGPNMFQPPTLRPTQGMFFMPGNAQASRPWIPDRR